MSKTEIKYRTLDDVMDAVKIDMRHYALEGIIEPQTLISTARWCNYILGLKINPSHGKVIEINNYKGRMPYDFDVLNFAILCDHTSREEQESTCTTYTDGVLCGIALQKKLNNDPCIKSYTTYMDLVYGANQIIHGLGSTNFIIQAFAPDGTILMFDVEIVTMNEINVLSNNPTTLQNIKIVIYATDISSQITDSAASLTCSADGETFVSCESGNKKYVYKNVIPIQMERSKSVSADCVSFEVRGKYKGRLKNNFFEINYPSGVVYINYQSSLEDEDGNMLTMDHPLTNMFYEYALKRKIYEDLMSAGENVAHMIDLTERRFKDAKRDAVTFINTPDFKTLYKIWEMNRKSMYYKYYNMFKG